ncbi:MAG TPA: hypothetical protein VH815_10620 [Acidobacteriota bacterium]
MKRFLPLFIFAIVLAFPLVVKAEVNFTGTWKKNTQQSDDPQKKFEKKMEERNSSDSSHQHHYPHADSRMGQRMGNGEHHDSEDHGGFMRFPDQLTIEYNQPELKLSGENDWERTLFTDGRKSEREINTPRGKGNLVTIANWEGDQLKVENQGPGGGKSTTTYELAPDGKQLFVQIKMQPMFSDEPITIRYVYDKVTQ